MKKFEPELGQALFGQPYREYEVSNLLEAALVQIDNELSRVMWNVNQSEYPSPFGNTGNSFVCDVFEVYAYSWNEDVPQPYNFRWRDVDVSWYKYLGRGMSVNQELTNDKISKLLDECLTAVRNMDRTDL